MNCGVMLIPTTLVKFSMYLIRLELVCGFESESLTQLSSQCVVHRGSTVLSAIPSYPLNLANADILPVTGAIFK